MPFASHRAVAADQPVLIGNSENGRRGMRAPVARLQLPPAQEGWAPRIRMRLPNFSGATVDHPGLLHYTCKLETRVRPRLWQRVRAVGTYDERHPEDVSTVLRGKPMLCLEFADMVMTVPEPAPLVVETKRNAAAGQVQPAQQLESLSARTLHWGL